ncbi:MAG: hypothetical protein IPL23_19165 [Saprospiraceae bacterium]|nr:hypothetical protein [Saprospiraceae bacterium]MBK8636062.1 hypothetical protein [Saprospiraceae bacterium]HMS67889.1 hypothetical protein [Saprospiraceae bacterium]
MKKLIRYSLLLIFGLGLSSTHFSCKVKEGCGYEDKSPQVDGNGKLTNKRGKSKLFN